MIARISQAFDPMVRLLVAAILLATVLPVTGEAKPIAQNVSNTAIFLLFLLNGLRLPRDEIVRGIGNWRFLAPLALWCFVAMGLAGWGVSLTLAGLLPPLVALGFLYLGVLPSTVQSATAYSSLAGGSVASSVVAAALLNIAGVFVSAPLFSAMAGGSGIGIDLDGLARVGMILLLPFTLGQVARRWAGQWVGEHRQAVTWMDRICIATAVYVAFSAAVEQGIWGMLGLPDWAVLLSGVIVLLAFAFGGAWLLGGALKLDRGNRIAMLFAGAQKSTAMGVPLAAVLFTSAVAGIVLLPLLVYHLLQLAVSALLANRLAQHADAGSE